MTRRELASTNSFTNPAVVVNRTLRIPIHFDGSSRLTSERRAAVAITALRWNSSDGRAERQATPPAGDEIRTASIETIDEWDSLASVTLVAALQEEFGVEIDLGDLPELVSFHAVLRYLDVRTIPRSA